MLDADRDPFLDLPVEILRCQPFGVRAILLIVIDDPPFAFWAWGDRLEEVEPAEA